MLTSISRLFQLRPFYTTAIIGIPIIVLIAIGIFTVMAVKFIVFIVLPIALVVWLFRKIFGRSRTA
jgi:hypothetical protein